MNSNDKKSSLRRRIVVLTVLGAFALGCITAITIHLLLRPERIRVAQRTQWKSRGAIIRLTTESESWKHKFLDKSDCGFVKFLLLGDGQNIDEDIQLIMQLEKLQGLMLYGPEVTPAHVQRLMDHPTLRLLLLSDTGLTDGQWRVGNSDVDVQLVTKDLTSRMTELRIRFHAERNLPRVMHSRYPEVASELLTIFGQPAITFVDMRNVVVDRQMIQSLSNLRELHSLYVG